MNAVCRFIRSINPVKPPMFCIGDVDHGISVCVSFNRRAISAISDHRITSLLKDKRKKEERKPKEKETRHKRYRPKMGLVGAPLVYGQPLTGTNAAPDLLRDSRLIEKLKKKGAQVKDLGNLTFDIMPNDVEVVRGCRYARTVGAANKKIADAVTHVLADDRKCLMLGGDHSVAIGSLFGHSRVHKDLAVIWVDAHADINTPLTSESGNIHGMPLSFLMKDLPSRYEHSAVDGFQWCTPCISSKQLAYIGIRDVDAEEQKILNDLNICSFSVDDVRKHGIEEVVRQVLKNIDPDGNRSIHLSVDVDALDPHHMPATGTRVPGGLSLREMVRLVQVLKYTERVSVMDVVELNPMLTSRWLAYWSADVTVEIIMRHFGGKMLKLPWDRGDDTPHRGLKWKKKEKSSK